MDNPEKFAIFSTQDPDTQNIRTTQCVRHHHANKHKQRKQDMGHPTNNRRQRQTDHHLLSGFLKRQLTAAYHNECVLKVVVCGM